MRVPFSYLDRQFADVDGYLADLKEFVVTGDFTLGKPLTEFEGKFATLTGTKHAIGVNSGTDALMLPMKAAGIGPGDEVITTTMTFVATVGAIAETGATPVFVDSKDGFVIDAELIEAAITPKTKAIVPVHYTGNMPNMSAVQAIAEKHNLLVFEDACQAIHAQFEGKNAGAYSLAAGYSLHPLKNLNVWSDGGVITTNDDAFADKLRLMRNHGLVDRDHVKFYAHNSRLDTLQAVIGNRLIKEVDFITNTRIKNAKRYDEAFADLAPYIRVPERDPRVRHVFHLYIVYAERRDELLAHLHAKGVEAKIHYPIPMHLQEASIPLGYKRGDFPVAEAQCDSIVTLPAHQHLTEDEVGYAIEQVRAFYPRT
ncbi:MAG: DegT/DnrJ/EryC1/StrS family aminotransferase [Planctomycetota bacterium]